MVEYAGLGYHESIRSHLYVLALLRSAENLFLYTLFFTQVDAWHSCIFTQAESILYRRDRKPLSALPTF